TERLTTRSTGETADRSDMEAWLAAAWIGLVALTAVVWLRVRRRTWRVPAEYLDFVARLQHELASNHPDVGFRGWVPARFAVVLVVDGQETPVPLQPLYQQLEAFPDVFGELVDRLVREIRAIGLDEPTHHEFSDVATSILPQVKGIDWLRECAPAFGDSSLVHRELSTDLAICYVIDDSWSMVYVTQAHLRHWARSEDDIYHLATRNLLRLGEAQLPLPEVGEDPVIVRTGDGYDAARVLLLDPEQVEGLLVGVPDRDLLWLGAGDIEAESLAQLMHLNAEQRDESSHPISGTLYRMHNGELLPIEEPAQAVAEAPTAES
ncbi:MAG: DUF1444 family protein, partial [Planctomycetota bacterium]|nr:DUF1444 family protein [Planctomycetota bacterium]